MTAERGTLSNSPLPNQGSEARWQQGLLLLVALTPFTAMAFILAFGASAPIFANPPGILGLPAGIVAWFVGGAVASLSLLAVVRARGALARILAVTLGSVPALLLVALTPVAIEAAI